VVGEFGFTSSHFRTFMLICLAFRNYLFLSYINDKIMISLRRVNKNTRNSGFNSKYISLILAATMALLLWGYQKIYSPDSSPWLLYLAIGIGLVAFVLFIVHIIKTWTNHRKKLKKYD